MDRRDEVVTGARPAVTSAGQATVKGAGGSVSGTHTWAIAGTFIVTTTVSASSGTVVSVSKNVVVAAPS